jgi:GNAT superfamily N-acetyltransferase
MSGDDVRRTPLGELRLPDGARLVLRRATGDDLPELRGMLADDDISRDRESDDLEPYRAAFRLIDADPAHLLAVAVDGDELVGTVQLTVIPGLARAGALRGQLEAVRVRSSHRNRGLGAEMIAWAADEARARGCAIVQLTTDKRRTDAHRFYERLGFVASHEGFKRQL